jgi:DNA transposition AAA+ family ATPase
LVIDDIHEVRESCGTKTMLQCLGIIRQLHDMSGCGLVLAGANTFRNHIEEGRFVASMQQLRRRGIWMLQLEDNSTDEDMMLIAGHYGLGLPEGETAKTVRWIGNTMGLGKFCKFLEAASRDAVKRKETMGWEHFDKIYRKSEGLRNPKSLVRGK